MLIGELHFKPRLVGKAQLKSPKTLCLRLAEADPVGY